MSNKLIKYDIENNKEISFSDKQQQDILRFDKLISAATYYTAMALDHIIQTKGYLMFGCSTVNEYYELKGFSIPYGKELKKIGNRLNGISNGSLLEKPDSKVSSDSPKTDTISAKVCYNIPQNDDFTLLEGLSLRKLDYITRLEEDKLKELVESGKVKIKDKEFDLEEFKRMKHLEVKKAILDNRTKYDKKIKALTEERENLREDKKILESEKRELVKENETAKELEKLYGGTASKLEEKEELILETSKLLIKAQKLLVKSNVTTKDPESLQLKLKQTNEQLQMFMTIVNDKFYEVLVK